MRPDLRSGTKTQHLGPSTHEGPADKKLPQGSAKQSITKTKPPPNPKTEQRPGTNKDPNRKNSGTLRILYTNARAANHEKLPKILDYAKAKKADVVCIVETWWIPSSLTYHPAYVLKARQDRENNGGKGGGVVIYISTRLL